MVTSVPLHIWILWIWVFAFAVLAIAQIIFSLLRPAPTFTQLGDFYVAGLYSPKSGFLRIAWLGYIWVGTAQLLAICFDEYSLLWQNRLAWSDAGAPYAFVLLSMCVVMFFLSNRQKPDAFMNPCPLAVCTHVLVKNSERSLVIPVQTDDIRYFEVYCVRYCWDPLCKAFRHTAEDLSIEIAKQVYDAGGLVDKAVSERALLSGPNKIQVAVPSICEALAQQFLTSEYIFQYMAVFLNAFYAAWNLAILWFIIILGSGIHQSIFIVRKNQKQLDKMANTLSAVRVLRNHEIVTICSSEIVCGDILVISQGSAPCDCVILEGAAVVIETMLTGEPMPLSKVAVTDEVLPKNKLYMGTEVVQSSGGPKLSKGRLIAVATAIGGLSTKGSLVRGVLLPKQVDFKFDVQLQKLYMTLTAWGCLIFSLYVVLQDQPFINRIFGGLYVLTSAIDPNMPLSPAMAQAQAARWLAQRRIRTLVPKRIPLTGKMDTCVFDKTGTITKQGMDFLLAQPVGPDGKFAVPNTKVSNLPSSMQMVLGTCHANTMVGKEIAGNAVEVEMQKASGWTVEDSPRVCVSPTGERVDVLRILEFKHTSMTSGCIVRTNGRIKLILKGAYEKMGILASSLPQEYDEWTAKHAGDRIYVLAVGERDITDMLYAEQIQSLSREDLEKDISITGLLLFRNETRPDSQSALHKLQRANIDCVMCTGDNPVTALEVAREVGLLRRREFVMIDVQEGQLTFEGNNGSLRGLSEDLEGYMNVDIILTSNSLRWLDLRGMLQRVLPKVRIFARMQPEDKQRVVELYQSLGRICGMVGDGGNDCGALQTAHVGIALSGSDASLVAPLSTPAESLEVVVDVVRSGRACLATQFATVSWFMVAGLIISPSQWFLMKRNYMTFSESHYIFIRIGLCMVMMSFMTSCEPAKVLAKLRPTGCPAGIRAWLTILIPCIAWTAAFMICIYQLSEEPWYISANVVSLGCPSWKWYLWGDNFETEVTFLLTAIVLTALAYTLSFGAEHRRWVLHNTGLGVCFPMLSLFYFFLVWKENSIFHVIFRVNVDNASSMSINKDSFLAMISAGPIGGCMLGPQMLLEKERLGDRFTFPTAENNCAVDSNSNEPAHLHNIMPDDFRLFLSLVICSMVIFIMIMHGAMSRLHPTKWKTTC